MLDCCDSALKLMINLIPGARSTFVLRRGHRQLESTAIVRVIIRGGTWLMLVIVAVAEGLDNGCAGWNQIQVPSLQFFLESLNFSLALGQVPFRDRLVLVRILGVIF